MSLCAGLFNQMIDGIYSDSVNQFGDATYTLVYSNVKCRWQEKVKTIINRVREEVSAKVEVWIDKDYTIIEENWKVVKDGEDYFVNAIEKKYDIMGNLDHIKLYLS